MQNVPSWLQNVLGVFRVNHAFCFLPSHQAGNFAPPPLWKVAIGAASGLLWLPIGRQAPSIGKGTVPSPGLEEAKVPRLLLWRCLQEPEPEVQSQLEGGELFLHHLLKLLLPPPPGLWSVITLASLYGKGGGTYHSLADGKSGVLCDPPPQKNIWAWFAFRSKPVGLNSLCRWSQRGQDCSLNWADHAKQSWFEPANCNSVGVSKRQGRCRLSKGGRELARGEQQRLCIYSVKMASPVHRSAPSPFHPCNSHKAIKGNDSFNQQQKPGGGGCLHIWGFRIIGLTLG